MSAVHLLRAALVAALVGGALLSPAPARAAVVIASSQSVGYTGTYTQYASLAAYNANSGGVTGSVPQRDLSLYVTLNPGAYDPLGNAVILATRFQNTDGTPNANNVNNGFLQINNFDGSNATINGFFNSALNAYQVQVSGTNAGPNPGQDGRFGAEGATTSVDTAGTFLSYDLDVRFYGLNGTGPATSPPPYTGLNADPSGVLGAAQGTFNGVFLNEDGSVYVLDLTINTSNVAGDVRDPNQENFASDTIGQVPPFAQAPVPEPATLATVGLIGAAALAFRRRARSPAAV